MLIHNPQGHYQFLKGIDPYSCGVIADSGFEIVQVSLTTPMDWRSGFDCIGRYLDEIGEGKSSLCAVQLRCPAPYSMEGFIAFNQGYCQVLQDWGLFVHGINPVARTNVAPADKPPADPNLFSFFHTSRISQPNRAPSFVVAGAGELLEGKLDARGIVRRGETSGPALHEKATYVAKVMNERLLGLGAKPDAAIQINIYTIHPLDVLLSECILPAFPLAAQAGIHWYPSQPPVREIEFEMDVVGVRRKLWMEPTRAVAESRAS